MQNERKITILGDTGETLELEQLSLLVLHDPETDEEREIHRSAFKSRGAK